MQSGFGKKLYAAFKVFILYSRWVLNVNMYSQIKKNKLKKIELLLDLWHVDLGASQYGEVAVSAVKTEKHF